MEATQFIAAVTGHRDEPGYTPTPDDELRALFEAFHQLDALIARLAAHADSPTHVLLTAMTLEQAQHALDIAKIKLAQLSRQALVHELPAETLTVLRRMADDPAAFVPGKLRLPEDPRTVPTGRLQFKTPADCLAAMAGIDYWAVLRRINAADDLLPGTDEFGIPCGPRYPQLAEQLATGQGNLATVAAAARKLEKMRPAIEARPDAAEFARGAESRVAESIAAGEPKNTRELLDLISDELETRRCCRRPCRKSATRPASSSPSAPATSPISPHACSTKMPRSFLRTSRPRTTPAPWPATAAPWPKPPPSRPAPPTPPIPPMQPHRRSKPRINRIPTQPAPEPQRPPNHLVHPIRTPLFGTSTDGPDWFDRPAQAETFEDRSDPGTPNPDDGGELRGTHSGATAPANVAEPDARTAVPRQGHHRAAHLDVVRLHQPRNSGRIGPRRRMERPRTGNPCRPATPDGSQNSTSSRSCSAATDRSLITAGPDDTHPNP